MKIVLLVLALAMAARASRERRSYAHAHGYDVPVSVHTVVQPSSSLPVYEYPESTQIDTHTNTVYSVQVPITHTVTLEQPSHSRQLVYHAPPAYHAPVYNTPSYTPTVYHAPAYHTPVYRTQRLYAPSHPWVYQRTGSWC